MTRQQTDPVNIRQLPLPIIDVLDDLLSTLSLRHELVLEAPPGAGKTTVVPLALLLDAPWLGDNSIIMLQPRRVAARAAAVRMAELLGEEVGQRVGYQMRQESKTSQHTRIIVMTEGVLSRRLQDDPALEGVGVVIFDEFHERNLHSDLGLALCRQGRDLFREPTLPLKLLVMSATLQGLPVADYLDQAPTLRSYGKQFPVAVHFCPPPPQQDAVAAIAALLPGVLAKSEGDMLIFLPGQREINRCQAAIAAHLGEHTRSFPLHGGLSLQEQQRALRILPNQRKIVLATDIAETSLTIEGLRIVIDSGLSRQPRYDPKTGMSRLTTIRLSLASSDQRAGRAGRLGPGECYRLWSETEHTQLAKQTTAEILQADLAPLALQLFQWGINHPDEIEWLDPPPAGSYAQARELLASIGAIFERGQNQWQLSEHGRALAQLPAHPRLAHMLVVANQFGLSTLACQIAALISERDPLSFLGADLSLRISIIDGDHLCPDQHKAWLQRVRKQIQAFRAWLPTGRKPTQSIKEHAALGFLTALAYPDRIARRIDRGGRYQLSNGRIATLKNEDPLCQREWLVAVDVGGKQGAREDAIYVAVEFDETLFNGPLSNLVKTDKKLTWDLNEGKFIAQQLHSIGKLLWKNTPIRDVAPLTIKLSLLDLIRTHGLNILPWTDEARQWQARVLLVRQTLEIQDWPDLSDQSLLATLEQWLGEYLVNVRNLSQLAKLDLLKILQTILPWQQQQALDKLAPKFFTVPSHSNIAIDYMQTPPVLAVKLQEMFGEPTSPSIINDKVKLLLHLLSPAGRPLQITQDLTAFWQNSYQQVKKEMRGRYPKHPWPDEPTTSIASKFTSKRLQQKFEPKKH